MDRLDEATLRVTKRDRVVVENTWSRVKIKSKPTNLRNSSRIERYNGK